MTSVNWRGVLDEVAAVLALAVLITCLVEAVEAAAFLLRVLTW